MRQLDELAAIAVGDAVEFAAACDLAARQTHLHYFPMLHFYGGRGRLLWERHSGSILVYQISRRPTGSRMNLFLPPLPFDAAALRHALERIRDFNEGASARIFWLAEEDALTVAREGLAVFFRDDEYIFDRAAIMGLEGSGFRSLRQELSRAQKAGQVETRSYRMEDRPVCAAMVEDWKERLTAAGMKVGGFHAALACLAGADRFAFPMLSGLVVEIDGIVRGFAFSGKLSHAMGCNCLCVTDTAFRGLPQLLRYRLMELYPDIRYFNDSTDSGRQGLRELKQRFRPVAMLGLYGAALR